MTLVIHCYEMEIIVELQFHTVGQLDLICPAVNIEFHKAGTWIMLLDIFSD
jgi:hypothetical protein